jgi:hypothetical protein
MESEEVRIMKDVVLSFRPGEHRTYYDELQGDEYAVMLLDIPSLPEEHHPECMAMTVLCAQQYVCTESERPDELLWGWVHLTPDAKEAIGQDLEEGGASKGLWYYMRITSAKDWEEK